MNTQLLLLPRFGRVPRAIYVLVFRLLWQTWLIESCTSCASMVPIFTQSVGEGFYAQG